MSLATVGSFLFNPCPPGGSCCAEAQACGLPCVLAGTSSLPEVGDLAALYHDPKDVQASGRLLADVLDQHHLSASLREKGLANARRFSWALHAEKLIESWVRVQAAHATDSQPA